MRGDQRWRSVPTLVADAARAYGDAEALVDGDVRLSFAELGAAVRTGSRAVVASGVEPGDRVGIWAPNSAEWVVAALATLSAGGVLVPLNTRYKGLEAADILRHSKARALFTVRGFLGVDYVDALRSAGALPETVVVMRGDGGDRDAVDWRAFLDRAEQVPADVAGARAEAVAPDDLADLIYTSGTTGRPKGVMVSHAQNLRVYEVWSGSVGLRAGDRYLIVNPFFHTFGYKAGILSCLMRGATMLPLPVFDVRAVLDLVERERVTVLPGAPTIYHAILDHPDRPAFDLSSLRLAVTGAAAVPVELLRRMRAELTIGTILTGYGLTEATGTVAICRADDDLATIARTSGRAIPDTEVRAVDRHGKPCPVAEPGEIVVRGYNVMAGYVDDPESTAAAVDGDGWLHTGDVGVIDARGYVTITDRIKDMFIVGGFNAYPAEIENALLAHPAVGEVAVVGVPDDRLGEVGAAFVVPRPGQRVDPDELIAWSRERLANFKVPRRVEVLGVLPKNPSGKVLKYELREKA